MICRNCGGEIHASSGLCPHCAVTGIATATGLLTPPPASFPTSATSPDTLDQGATLGAAPEVEGPRPVGTGPLAPGQNFGRYHIIRLLGIGGMGAVYQAWDAELGVAVAVKVIRPEVMSDPAAAAEVERRFKRELLLARQVTHKNVVRIHDLGEIDGHQVHHDAVRGRRGSRDAVETRTLTCRFHRCSASRVQSCRVSSPRTRPAWSTAI